MAQGGDIDCRTQRAQIVVIAHSLELAELMAKIEKLAEKKAQTEERRMMKRFFEE